MNDRTYYVYMYLTEDLKPYYVGKGTGYRIHAVHSTVSLTPRERRVFVRDGLTNEEASEFEIELILKYGRKKDGGLLENVKIREWTSFKGWTHSDYAKKQISEKNTGKVRTEKHRAHYRIAKQNMTHETKEKIRKANLGRIDGKERVDINRSAQNRPEVRDMKSKKMKAIWEAKRLSKQEII